MGLEKYGAELLCLLQKKGIPLGDFLMLGRQNLRLGSKDVKRLDSLFGVKVDDLLEGNPDETYSEPFLERLGAQNIDSMDYSDYEGASLIHNLNEPIPKEFENRFDMVFDGGTLEHLFHFPVAIRNGMRMIREGGYYVACTPSNGFNGHGFYQFSPELFFRVFSPRNGFKVKLMALGEATRSGRIFAVEDPEETGVRLGVNTGFPTSIIFAAQRVSTDADILREDPVQQSYSSAWAEPRAKSSVEGHTGFASRGKEIVKKVIPDSLIEWRNVRAIQTRNRNLWKSLTRQISQLEEAWISSE